MTGDDLPTQLTTALQEHLDVGVAGVRPSLGDGWTATTRSIVTLADGRGVFVKHALTETTASWLRTEAANYGQLESPHFAEMHAFIDGERPTLVLEDLSRASWPPPWRGADLDAAHSALDSIARLEPRDPLPRLPARLEVRGGWRAVDPRRLGELLSPGIDPRKVAGDLASFAETCDGRGTATVLLDARAGNVCIVDGAAKWVDLDGLSIGNVALSHALLDISAGGANAALRDSGAIAHVSGTWAESLGAPSPDWAPGLRERELPLLRNALRLMLGPDAVNS